MRIAVTCILAVTLATCGPSAQRSEPAQQQLPLVFAADDGIQIHASLYPVPDSPPGLVLVHMLGQDQSSWQDFAQQAQRNGLQSLAIDLRGHGQSLGDPMAPLSYETFTTQDWEKALLDIDAAVATLKSHGADPENLFLVGASIGANLCLRYAAKHRDIQAVVLVSPGIDYKGIAIEADMTAYARRPAMLLAAEGDAYSATTVHRLNELAKGFCEVREYAGAAHGTEIFAANEGATAQVLLWLQRIADSAPRP